MRYSADAPRVLYHYTDAVGLHGILSTNELWATDIAFMNDESELQYAGDLVDSTLTDLSRRIGVHDSPELAYLRDGLGAALTQIQARSYAVCFSERPDDLNQWESYGSASNGRYAIGIDTRGLGRFLGDAVELTRMNYDRASQCEQCLCVIEERLSVDSLTDMWADAIDCIPSSILEVAQTWKNPSFSHEREWRVVFTSEPDEEVPGRPREDTRVRGWAVVPFRRLGHRYDRLPVTEIVIGPCRYPDITARGVMAAAVRYGFGEVQLRHSEVPLRDS